MKTVEIKGKKYIEVNERLKYFRQEYPEYTLRSEWLKLGDDCVCKAIIENNGVILAEGTANERRDEGYINKTSHYENCETSAWGRALANFGIGIDASVASAQEVMQAQQKQVNPPPLDPELKKLSAEANKTEAETLKVLAAIGRDATIKKLNEIIDERVK